MIKAILACDSMGGIGKNGSLPWPHNAKDLANFKRLTDGCTVVMGRCTWESDMPTPLPNRHNVVVSRDQTLSYPGADLLTENIAEHLTEVSKTSTVYVIGGAGLFRDLIDEISILYLTRIEGDYNCDTFLPLEEIKAKFRCMESYAMDDKTTFETHFTRYLNDLSISTAT